jgi:hypothetical protein
MNKAINEQNIELQNTDLIEIEEIALQGVVYHNCCRIVQFD